MNPMKNIRIEKVTLNIGAGKSQDKLEKGVKLLSTISHATPVKTVTQKRIAQWGLRPGLPIGCKVTLRGEEANKLLVVLLGAKDQKLSSRQFDNEGNVAFGIHEYIDIPGSKYDPAIGVMGLQVCITLERPGFSIRKRRLRSARVPANHRIKRQEAIDFMKENFKVLISEEQ
ncbi:50S ribosomal protein L5 [Candidatus Woesearchaeota archaeon]|nr:50S ribosomal protein L5 [Candidatus Woesearchaeota archaeon]